MKNVFRNVGIGVVVGLLVGCTSMPPIFGGNQPSRRTPTESKSCADIYQGENGANDQFWTRVVPVILGTIAGAAAGNAIGKDTESTVTGAILGGLAGLTLGDLVAKRKQGYANQEAAILTECEIVKRQIDALMAENRQLAQDIKGYRQKIAAYGSKKKFLQTERKNVEKSHKKAKQKLAKAKTDLKNANAQYDRQKTGNTKKDAELKKWKTQVANLEKEKHVLQDNVDTLFSMTQSL